MFNFELQRRTHLDHELLKLAVKDLTANQLRMLKVRKDNCVLSYLKILNNLLFFNSFVVYTYWASK